MAFVTFDDTDGRKVVINSDHMILAIAMSHGEVRIHLSGGEAVVARETLDNVIRKLSGQKAEKTAKTA